MTTQNAGIISVRLLARSLPLNSTAYASTCYAFRCLQCGASTQHMHIHALMYAVQWANTYYTPTITCKRKQLSLLHFRVWTIFLKTWLQFQRFPVRWTPKQLLNQTPLSKRVWKIQRDSVAFDKQSAERGYYRGDLHPIFARLWWK